MENASRYVILGAGPTGLGAAYRLREIGERSFALVERNARAGGLASSFRDDAGFLWDIGGHVHFSHYPYFDEAVRRVLPDDAWNVLQRQAWVWMYDTYIPYPLQYNAHRLPLRPFWACLKGAFAASMVLRSKPASNFKEWILKTFGKGLAQEFLYPYNWKVWAYPVEEMSYRWIGERVAVVRPGRMLWKALTRSEDRSWGPNSTFRFPKNGGTGALWEAMGKAIGGSSILYNEEAVRMDPGQRLVFLRSGRTLRYDQLLSTLPLDRLIDLLPDAPAAISQAAHRLKHSTSHIVGIGLRGQPPKEMRSKSWIYFPQPEHPFYRVTVFSNYSDSHTPDPAAYWSLLTETSESPLKPVDPRTLIDQTVESLIKIGLIASADRVISRWQYKAEYGYPTPSLDRDDILQTVLPYLETLHIYSRGRFGAWRYEVSNQDHSFMQGVEWVNRLAQGAPEVTLSEK